MDESESSCRFAWQKFLYDISLRIRPEEGEVILTAHPFQLETSLTKFVPGPGSCSTNLTKTNSSHPSTSNQIPKTSKPDLPLTLTINSNNCKQGHVIGTRVVDSTCKGIRHPCILLRVQTTSKKTSIYLIHLLSGGLKLAGQYRLDDNEVRGDDIKFQIQNEQLVSFLTTDKIHLIRFRDGRKLGYTCACPLPDGLVDSDRSINSPLGSWRRKLLAYDQVDVNHALSAETFCDILWLFSVKHAATETANNPWELQSPDKTEAILISLSQEHTCKIELLDGTDFLPHIYGGLVKCLTIQSAQVTSGQMKQTKGVQVTRPFESLLIALTARGQLLCFENGQLQECIAIDSASGTEGTIMTFRNSSNELYYVIHNQNQRQSALVIDAQTFKVKHTFPHVNRVYAGDFCGSCGDQLLLVSDKEENTSPLQWDNFIVTDFSACNINFAEGGRPTDESLTDDSFHAAVQALEGRLQASITYACGAQRELENKKRLVENTFETLRQLSLDREGSSKSQAGLMPLLGEEDTQHETTSSAQSECRTLRALETWQNVFDDYWVIGVVLSNTSKRHVGSIKVSVISQEGGDQPNDCSSFFIPTDHNRMNQLPTAFDEDLPPRSKCRKIKSDPRRSGLCPQGSLRPGETATVLVRTKIPGFFMGNTVAVKLMGSWVELPESAELSAGTGSVQAGVAYRALDTPWDDPQAVTRCEVVGRIQLTSHEVVSGSLRVQPDDTISPNGLLVMDAVQTHYPLTLHALFTDLRDFPTTTLQTALYFTRVDTAHCWVPPQGAGRLNQVRLEVLPRTRPQRLDISVCCGDEAQVFLLVHMLYEALADDVTILPRDANDVTALTTSVLNAITTETDFVRKSAATLLYSPIRNTAVDQEKGETSKGSLQMIRKEFQQKQKHLQSAKDSTVESEKLEMFQRCLHRLQKQTNNSVEGLCTTVRKALIS